MSESERLGGLRTALDESAAAYRDEGSFIDWQGRCFGLLGYNIIHQERFRGHAERILDTHEFHSRLIKADVRALQLKLEGILSQAIGDLESKDRTPSVPSTKITPPRKSRDTSPPPKNPPILLDKEQGMLWYWHHCHFTIKWKVIGSLFALLAATFAVGVTAGRNQFFQKLWDLLQSIVEHP